MVIAHALATKPALLLTDDSTGNRDSKRSKDVQAIVLTTVLFTSLFAIADSIVHSFQQQTFPQVGGNQHGGFKSMTLERVEELLQHPLIVKSATRLILGMPTGAPFNKAHVKVRYMDEANAEGSFYTPEVGSLPREGTVEIACDSRILPLLGVEPKIGASITLPYYNVC